MIRQTIRYCRRFGIRTGIQVARAHAQSNNGRSPSTRPIVIKMRGLSHPVLIRGGTSDPWTFDEVFVAQEYKINIPGFAPKHILDLGANVGYASIYFANTWPNARILALEPEAGNFSLLERNVSKYSNVQPANGAVWSRPTSVTVANPAGYENSFQMVEGVGGSAIRAYTISELADTLGGTRIDLLKMDIEGAEAEVLNAARDWIDRIDVMVIELHDRFVPGCGEALVRALSGKRFRSDIVGRNLVFDFRS
jgi:FkbM family methyltransferase